MCVLKKEVREVGGRVTEKKMEWDTVLGEWRIGKEVEVKLFLLRVAEEKGVHLLCQQSIREVLVLTQKA